jgi:hypothetical protein
MLEYAPISAIGAVEASAEHASDWNDPCEQTASITVEMSVLLIMRTLQSVLSV